MSDTTVLIAQEAAQNAPKTFVGRGNGINVYDTANIYGKSGTETAKLQDSANATIDQNIGRVEFAGNMADYSFQMDGNQAHVYKGGIQIALIGINGGANGTGVAFADGTTQLKITGLNKGTVGGQAITNTTSTSVNPTALGNNFSTTDKATVGTPVNTTSTDTNLAFLDAGRSMTLIDKAKVYGGTGTEILKIGGNAEITTDQNIERVELSNQLSDCGFKITGNTVSIYSKAQPTIIIALIAVQGDSDGTILAFKDGSTHLKIKGLNQGILGNIDFTNTNPLTTDSNTIGSFDTTDKSTVTNTGAGTGTGTTTTTPLTSSSVSVTAGNTTPVDASTLDATFSFAQGNYTYNIAKFGAGDKLAFAANAALSILNIF